MDDSAFADMQARIRERYSEVAAEPELSGFFHTGRAHAARLGYDAGVLELLPDCATESFCGVGNPFELRRPTAGDRVVDVGCGAGLDCLLAAQQVGPQGAVVGVDMTDAMVEKARRIVTQLGLSHVTFLHGMAENLPVDAGWADSIISNGVFNLSPDKRAVVLEAWRCLRPGGYLHFADVSFPTRSREPQDTQGFLCVERWAALLGDVGFVDITIGPGIDTFAGAPSPPRTFQVFGYSFAARRPTGG